MGPFSGADKRLTPNKIRVLSARDKPLHRRIGHWERGACDTLSRGVLAGDVLPAIGCQRRSRDEPGIGSGQERHTGGDLLGLPEAANWDRSNNAFQNLCW